MKLEDQVCSLELAKRLKELGVKQESAFWWIGEHVYFSSRVDEFTLAAADCAAFTVGELGDLMKEARQLDFLRAYCDFMDLTLPDIGGPNRALFAHNLMTEPDYGAKMLIYLIENKLIVV